MEQKTSFLGHALKWGAILGLASIIFSLFMWILNILPSNFLVLFMIFVVSISLTVIFVVIGTKKYRDTELGGKISFGKAFFLGILIVVFSSILTTAFSFLLTNVIDKTYTERSIEATKNWTTEMLQKRGVPDEMIDNQIKKIDEKGKPTVTKTIVNSLLFSLIFGSIISVITGLSLKREDKVFESKVV